MKTSKTLKEERAVKFNAQEQLINARKAKPEAEQVFSAEERTTFDGLTSEIEALDILIAQRESDEKQELRIAAAKGISVDPKLPEPKKQERFSISAAINNIINNRGLSTSEIEVRKLAAEELRASGITLDDGNSIAIPSSMMRAQTVGDDAGAKGGKLVASTPQHQMPLQPTLRVEALGADIMTGLVGDVPLPTNDAFSFGFYGETEKIIATDVGFAGPTLKPKRAGGVVELSKKLLLQSGFNVDAYIMQQINIAIDVVVTRASLNGAGGNEPLGLYSLITTNVQAGAAGNPTHADMVGLKSLIKSANATENNLQFIFDPAMLGKLETTKVDAGSGVFVAQNDKIVGHNYLATTLADTLDAGVSHPVIFGDWAQLKVGRWGGVSFLVDPFTSADAGKVRLIIEVYTDVAVANEKAFAIRKNFTV